MPYPRGTLATQVYAREHPTYSLFSSAKLPYLPGRLVGERELRHTPMFRAKECRCQSRSDRKQTPQSLSTVCGCFLQNIYVMDIYFSLSGNFYSTLAKSTDVNVCMRCSAKATIAPSKLQPFRVQAYIDAISGAAVIIFWRPKGRSPCTWS